ncbi:MAG: fatty acid desaturase [Bdellovibrionota bacterium]
MKHATTSAGLDVSELRTFLRKYSQSSVAKGLWQIANSVVPFVAIWAAMIFVSFRNPWAVLPLAFVNGLLMTRIFVLQHDCGHHTLFPAKNLNNIFGNILSLITFTPLYNWRREHNLHHSHIGNLDKVEHGDFWMMTVDEYRVASPSLRFKYRIYRNPLVLFVIGPVFYLLVRRRLPVNLASHLRRERRNVHATNLALASVYGALAFWFGWKLLLLCLLPIVVVGASICVFGFYVQHTYEEGYWQRDEKWNYHQAALTGSSYYDLPGWMLWFTADISVHHIHHLDSSIPNYNLQKCWRENPQLRPAKSMTFVQSLGCVAFKLWDEEANKFVGYPA